MLQVIRNLLFIVLLFASVAHPTTYYVATDGSDANDGLSPANPFLTINKGIQSCAASGDVVSVASGSYGAGSDADQYYLDLDEANIGGKTLTVVGESESGCILRPKLHAVRVDSDVTTDFTITFQSMTLKMDYSTGSGNATIEHKASVGNLVFSGCTIGHDNSNATTEARTRIRYYTTTGAYSTGTVGVSSGTCTLSGGTWPTWVASDSKLAIETSASVWEFYTITSRDSDTVLTVVGDDVAAGKSFLVANTNFTRTLTLTDCTIEAGTADDAAPNIYFMACGGFEIDGCTMSGGGGDFVSPYYTVNGAVVVKNNTITASAAQGHGADFLDFEASDTNRVLACDSVAVYNNTATNLRNGFRIYMAACPVYVANNVFTVSQNTAVDFILHIGDDETPDETDTYISEVYDEIQIIGNEVAYTGTDSGHGILIGGTTLGATVLNNYVEGGNFGIVCKGKGTHIIGNIVNNDNALLLSGAQGCIVMNNTFYAPNGYAFQCSLNSGQGTARNPSFNVIINNIFQAATYDYCYDLSARFDNYDQFFDYNNAFGGTVALLAYNGSTYDTFAALKSAESTWKSLGGDELDSNSKETNPILRNPSNDDFRLSVGSPCLNAGKSILGRRSIGAWGPYASPVRSRRRTVGTSVYRE